MRTRATAHRKHDVKRSAPAAQKKPEDYAIGTVFRPHEVGAGYIVQFTYGDRNYFECELLKDGTLSVRVSGQHSDLLATHHHVANAAIIVARRWNTDLGRHADIIKDEA